MFKVNISPSCLWKFMKKMCKFKCWQDYASMHAKLLLSCPILCDPMDCVACQASLSMGFFMQEYWSRLPFPSPGDLHNPGVEPTSHVSCIDRWVFLPLAPSEQDYR